MWDFCHPLWKCHILACNLCNYLTLQLKIPSGNKVSYLNIFTQECWIYLVTGSLYVHLHISYLWCSAISKNSLVEIFKLVLIICANCNRSESWTKICDNDYNKNNHMKHCWRFKDELRFVALVVSRARPICHFWGR